MKLIIELPEEYYKAIMEIPVNQSTADMLIIRNGIPLPKGRWIEQENCYECSNCGIIRAKGKTGLYNYCPNCGAKMVGDTE